jgi:hypothetical protein
MNLVLTNKIYRYFNVTGVTIFNHLSSKVKKINFFIILSGKRITDEKHEKHEHACHAKWEERCCYRTVNSGTTVLQNGACTYRCIYKQMPYKTPISHNGNMKSLEIYENYITLFCLEKTKLPLTILYKLRTMHGILTNVVEFTIYNKQQLRNNTILSRALLRNAQ